MFKKFLRKNHKNHDIRFLDAESYKFQQLINSSRLSKNVDDEPIQVEKDKVSSSFNERERSDSSSFLELIRQATSNTFDGQQDDQLHRGSVTDCKRHLNSLGVFSDSKMYSVLVHFILSKYELDIKHFNHPATFKKDKYPFFDTISSWIIFISDEQDSGFLDNFLDRYVDKPTLFLFSKVNKEACMSSIEKFIKQNNLETLASDQGLSALAIPTCDKG